jgi:bleomycin hydrolase
MDNYQIIMKKLFLVAIMSLFALSLGAQEPEAAKQSGPYQFTVTDEAVASSVKNQSSSSTCWSFAGIGMVESDLMRLGKGEYDLSEMWIVRNAYFEKAVKYVRMHGTVEFGPGGATHDVYNMILKYGIVPDEVYTGLQYGTDIHRHSELDAVLRAYVDAVIKDPNNTISTAWQAGVNGILDAYLGKAPEKFTYNGVEYTPKSFAESLDLTDFSDYVAITSFSHHPFYTEVALEIPDNWAWGTYYNVPVEEMMSLIDNSLENGYAVDWGADVSEPGFQYSKGFAVIPDSKPVDMSDSEWARWERMSATQRNAMVANSTEPIAELEITQENRQEAFDNYQTTDDHGMLFTAIAHDQNGNKFYKVKNSWGTDQLYDGYFYASPAFVAYKTTAITVHKDMIPKELKKKLGIE